MSAEWIPIRTVDVVPPNLPAGSTNVIFNQRLEQFLRVAAPGVGELLDSGVVVRGWLHAYVYDPAGGAIGGVQRFILMKLPSQFATTEFSLAGAPEMKEMEDFIWYWGSSPPTLGTRIDAEFSIETKRTFSKFDTMALLVTNDSTVAYPATTRMGAFGEVWFVEEE